MFLFYLFCNLLLKDVFHGLVIQTRLGLMGVLTRLQVSFHLFLCVGWKQKIPQNITKNLAEVEKIVYVYHWHHWPK